MRHATNLSLLRKPPAANFVMRQARIELASQPLCALRANQADLLANLSVWQGRIITTKPLARVMGPSGLEPETFAL